MRIGMGFAALGLGWLCCCLWEARGEPRTWKDASGKFSIDAEFVEYEQGTVRLKQADEKVIEVPMLKLSAADQKWIRDEIRRRREEATGGNSTGESSTSKSLASGSGALSGEWPQWRGPQRDGISPETGLMKSWPADGPPLAWQARGLGRGYSSLAIAGGKIYTMGQRGGNEYLIALNQADGQQAWATAVGRADHSNGTPTVDGDLVFCVGLSGDLLCANAQTGGEIWRKNYGRDFGGRMMSGWGFSESPLIDGDRLICTPGGEKAAMVALEKRTGNVIWSAPMPYGGQRGQDGAGYSSIVVSNGAGMKQYVQVMGRGVVGVDAETGQVLWRYDRIANGTANIPTPIVKGDYVLCSTGYGDGGTALLKLSGGRGRVAVSEVYYHAARDVQNHHGGMVLLGDYVYLGHGHNNGLPMCMQFSTGKVAWGPGRGPGSGSAALAYADGHLYFRYENGVMAPTNTRARPIR